MERGAAMKVPVRLVERVIAVLRSVAGGTVGSTAAGALRIGERDERIVERARSERELTCARMHPAGLGCDLKSCAGAAADRMRITGPVVALVSCCKPKRATSCRAAELYTSQLFTKSLAFARTYTDYVFIVSALHGLLALDDVIAPYDQQIGDLTREQRAAWGADVVAKLAGLQLFASEGWLDATMPASATREVATPALIVLAGELYANPIRVAAERRGWPIVEEPLRRMTIGERLHFLTTTKGPHRQ